MERLTNNIADKIAKELKLDQDNKEVIAYGLFAILDIALSILLVAILGRLFNVMVEALIVCFTGSMLRKYSGGAHASSPGICAAISVMICVGQAIIFVLLFYPIVSPLMVILLGIIIFLWAFSLIYKLAPVDSLAKPIRTKEKRYRMKKGSLIVLCLYAVVISINTVVSVLMKDKRLLIYSLCLYGGIVWQTYTLTQKGHKTMHKIDNLIAGIIKFIKGVR